ncbi:MAG: DUF4105 domain-containing protein [Elusimicrobia bacterium]|nr:DUF4105 domain-containing protein [Elusimicrobiota bacterium]
MKIKQAFFWLGFLAMSCWAITALVYSNLSAGPRLAAAGAFGILALCSVILPRKNSRKTIFFLPVFALVLAWWLLLPPSNNREWAPDVATLPSADISGSTITIHNIRDCDYRTEKDYVVQHYDRTFTLGSVRSMDLFMVDWGLPHVAHTMLSFGLGGDKYVCFSIEARKKKGEEYSSVRGFFKQYELTYIVADERDVVRLRTNYRKGEDVYLYHITADPEMIQMIFMDYLRSVNELKDKPEWYNALTANCTTDIWKHVVPYYPKAKFDWRILASGHLDEMVYKLGVMDQTLPLQELKRRSFINERSRAAGRDRAFSRIIRQGLPGFD